MIQPFNVVLLDKSKYSITEMQGARIAPHLQISKWPGYFKYFSGQAILGDQNIQYDWAPEWGAMRPLPGYPAKQLMCHIPCIIIEHKIRKATVRSEVKYLWLQEIVCIQISNVSHARVIANDDTVK